MNLKSRIASLILVGTVTVGLTVMPVGAADHHADKDIVDTAVAVGSIQDSGDRAGGGWVG